MFNSLLSVYSSSDFYILLASFKVSKEILCLETLILSKSLIILVVGYVGTLGKIFFLALYEVKLVHIGRLC